MTTRFGRTGVNRTRLRVVSPRAVSGTPLALALLATLATADGASAQQTGLLLGAIRSTSGQPLAGAQVSVEPLEIGTLANNVGRYRLEDLPPGRYTVRVHYLGFAPMSSEVTVTPGGSITADFELRSEVISLEGIVVSGPAGVSRRREIGNAITQVNAAQVENVAVSDVGDILQGRALGATILDNSGQVGAGNSIRLRGTTSITQSTVPLVYIDGVRMQSEAYNFADGLVNQAANPLGDINPNDIERIEIVKGAAATTLYGTEAAPGVIQIFTKRGASGAPAWSLSVDQGFNELGHIGPSADVNPTGLGFNRCDSDEDPMFPADPTCPASGSWLKRGKIQRYNLSVRGGSDRTNYFVSSSWGSERGVFNTDATPPADYDYPGILGGADQGQTSWGVRGNFGFMPAPGLDIRFNSAYSRRDIDWVSEGNSALGLTLNVLRGSAGYTGALGDGLTTADRSTTHSDHLFSGVNVVLSSRPDLPQRVNLGLDWSLSGGASYLPWGHWWASDGARWVDDVSRRKLTLDYMGSWNRDVSTLASTFSWGGQIHDDRKTGLFATGTDFTGPGEALINSGEITSAEEYNTRIKSGGFFLQEMLGWRDRLFVTAGLRFDSHVAFGRDARIERYPKASLAYVISEEEWAPDWLGTLKLRTAIGESGDAGGVFDAVRTFLPGSADEQVTGVTVSALGNPDLGPERSREWEVGVEGSTLRDRVSFEYTYYRQGTRDALIDLPQVPSAGFLDPRLENVGDLRNFGHEALFDVRVVESDDVWWNVGVHGATNGSEVVTLGNVDANELGIHLGWGNYARVGQPISVQCDEAVVNRDEVGVAPVTEEKCFGPTIPTHTYGVSTTLTLFRRLTLNALGEGMGGNTLGTGTAYQNAYRGVWPLCRGELDMIDAGRLDELTAAQRGRCYRPDMAWGEWDQPADFFKIRSASITYRMPEGWLPGSVRGATVSLQGKNLLTLTDFDGLDPESSEDGAALQLYRFEYYNIPPLRSFILNVKMDF